MFFHVPPKSWYIAFSFQLPSFIPTSLTSRNHTCTSTKTMAKGKKTNEKGRVDHNNEKQTADTTMFTQSPITRPLGTKLQPRTETLEGQLARDKSSHGRNRSSLDSASIYSTSTNVRSGQSAQRVDSSQIMASSTHDDVLSRTLDGPVRGDMITQLESYVLASRQREQMARDIAAGPNFNGEWSLYLKAYSEVSPFKSVFNVTTCSGLKLLGSVQSLFSSNSTSEEANLWLSRCPTTF